MTSTALEIARLACFVPKAVDIEHGLAGQKFEDRNWAMTLAQCDVRWHLGMPAEQLPYADGDMQRFGVGAEAPELPFPDLANAKAFVAATKLRSTCICDATMSASDMAARALQSLLDACLASGETPKPDFLLYAHVQPEQNSNLNPAFRLQHLLGDEEALPLAISQNDVVSTFRALELALRLVQAGEAQELVLVAADKCMLPAPRRLGDITLLGDAAGAAWLRRAGPGSSLTLHDVLVQHVDHEPLSQLDPAQLASLEAQYVEAAVESIKALLSRNGMSGTDLGAVVPQRLQRRMMQAVHEGLGIPATRICEHDLASLGNLASADLLVSLEALLRGPAPVRRDMWLLAWSIGIGGYVGSALLRWRAGGEAKPR
ncbi:3-oxoacyl-[acyl-carrier-protein] synthase III C-terminal domain-containing protein [Paucibacter sp. XJ19-41]|uniref:3-oxoacyl-[acyl-carrier-protein] synthase III C-terminal domain-containing protein n=1 Tax=Paucibacter sp. XJ19-41 TaxID=2927824 RepID=UPI00234B60D2|nr:3-oxoacyl-[acyl-carrier-protein] synthase III C-terminal domain-containing protein [Paucibacter sp. XJ19-41]MDC6167153.1 3-oxoacyl-[acyl-carrier-protein] synthase III C-terminal domain-containing protein [Paucibacter sp. XJ19-41]